jgi:hypothetical protein
MLQGCDMFAIRRVWHAPKFGAVNTYRNAAMVLAACAASLSLAACTAGITTTSTATSAATGSSSPSRSATAASSARSPAAAAASAAATGRTIKVSSKIGRFPVPGGAKVVEDVAAEQETVVFFTLVTPAKVASFYAQALPRAGYKVTANSVFTQSGTTVADIQFTGHGVKGNIDALSKFADPSVNISDLGHKNVTTVTFMPG